jgi:hypothetical protein
MRGAATAVEQHARWRPRHGHDLQVLGLTMIHLVDDVAPFAFCHIHEIRWRCLREGTMS